MTSVTIVGSGNNVQADFTVSGCVNITFYSFKLYRGAALISTFNTTGASYTFIGVEVGFSYYVIAEVYVDDTVLCQSATSNTIAIESFCIPANKTDIKFSDLAVFYGLNNFDIRLSGIINPSVGNNIFGKSALPISGVISKTTPNAVSELRGTCGGSPDIFGNPSVGESFFRYIGTVSEGSNFSAGFIKNSSTGIFLLLSPFSFGSVFVVCGGFSNQRSEIMQTNGVAGVETIGPKTIRIGFASSNLQVALTGTIVVRRLSDDAIVASAIINSPVGTNLFIDGYTLNWSNSSNNTKISVIVTVDQGCVV